MVELQRLCVNMGCGQSSNTKVNKNSTKTNTRRHRRKVSLSDTLELAGCNIDEFAFSYDEPAAAYQDETQTADTVPATTEQEDTREDQQVQQQNLGSSVMNTGT